MDHSDHVTLLRPAIPTPTTDGPPGTWADIGAGHGAFTLALAELLGPGARIIAVDKDRGALEANARSVRAAFPETVLTTIVADLRALPHGTMPLLDGMLAANSLHYVPRGDQAAVIASLAARVRPNGTFIVVEYDADRGNHWVPYPFSSRTWPSLAAAAGLVSAREMGRVPSRFLGAIYSASAHTPGA